MESKELEAWIVQQADDRLTYRTEKELALRDKDGDGAISFQEYNPQFSNEDLGNFYTAYVLHVHHLVVYKMTKTTSLCLD